MSKWIDFKELRAKLDFEQVLRHYGVEVHRKGNQHMGYCPLPNHNGKKNSQSFSANLDRGIFQCFGCGGKGNALDFAVLMEKGNPDDGEALRKVAIALQEKFCPESGKASANTAGPAQKKPDMPKEQSLPVVVNAPLDFVLKGLEQDHPYLPNRGFSKETIKHFGLGFCSRGFLKDRVAIPLHDNEGKLIGYAGRVVDDTAIGEENPRYKFPSKRERDGKIYEFRKSLFLYNGFRIKAPVHDLIVVEGFTSVWWLHQNGLQQVVAVMGSDCSDRQAEQIAALVHPEGSVWFMPDGDEAGSRFAESFLLRISPHRFVRWVKLDTGKQPTDYPTDRLRTLLGKGSPS